MAYWSSVGMYDLYNIRAPSAHNLLRLSLLRVEHRAVFSMEHELRWDTHMLDELS